MRRIGAVIGIAGALALGVAGQSAADEPGTKIVGGSATTISEYPWQVALAVNDALYPGDGYDRWFCGGTLVAPTIVITAAHCVFDNPSFGGFNQAVNFEVFTGRTTLSSGEGQAIDVAEIYYFEGSPGAPALRARSTDPAPAAGQLYDPVTGEWDAVFLRLAQPSTTGTPIKIAGADEAGTWAPGQPALISGWGDQAENAGDYSDQLRAAQISMLSDADCGNAYGAGFTAATMACAGVLAGGIDTCQGDSGGPLVVPVFQRSSRAMNGFRLVGDTSFGAGCARPNTPGVYGRLAADPMRSALRGGILAVAGVDVVGSGAVAADSTPPVVEITKHPHKRSEKNKAKFKFTAGEQASFECALDKGGFKACSSPYKKHVADRKHKFRVRATDLQGNVGEVDQFKWRVFG